MVSKIEGMPPAKLHTPEDLLQGAEKLVASDDPLLLRAGVLEAFSALETQVQASVVSALRSSAFPPLADWLKDELDDRLEKRLSLLCAVAPRRSKDVESQLRKDLGIAKNIRNQVTHLGLKVSAPDARFVIQTVYKWLAYIGSTVELELALTGLKKYVEDNAVSVEREEEAIALIAGYFGQSKAGGITEIPFKVGRAGHKRLSPNNSDLLLAFGTYRILIEPRLIDADEMRRLVAPKAIHHRDGRVTVRQSALSDFISEMPENMEILRDLYAEAKSDLKLTQAVFILFVKGINELPDEYCRVQRYHRDQVWLVLIKA